MIAPPRLIFQFAAAPNISDRELKTNRLVRNTDEANLLVVINLIYFVVVPDAADTINSDTSLGCESMGTWLLTITRV